MLVLTRRIGESIRVGDSIIIKVLEGGGGQVKIGITAPIQMPIHREEIYLRIREENLAAAEGRKSVNKLIEAIPSSLKTALGNDRGNTKSDSPEDD